MDVLRTGCSVGHAGAGGGGTTPARGARYRRPADRLLRLHAALLAPLRPAAAASRSRPTTRRPAATSCTCCTASRRRQLRCGRCDQSLILYAEHEFNASTFTARVIAGTGSDFYSAVTGAIGALRGPKHGGANEAAFEIQQRYARPDAAEADIRAASRGRKSSSALAIRSTPWPIRAIRSSRKWPAPCAAKRAT